MNTVQQFFVYGLFVPVWCLAVFIKLVSIIQILIAWNFPLNSIPGPRTAAWTRFWWIRIVYKEKVATTLRNLGEIYGNIVRVAPKTVLISDPETIRKVFAVGSMFKRGPWFDSLRLDPTITNVVSERDPKRHQHLLGMLGTGLSGKDISVEPTIDTHIHEWISKLDILAAKQHTSMDLSHSVQLLALDIVSHLCLGESFHCLENETDPYGYLRAVQSGTIAQQYIATILEIKTFLFFLAKNFSIRSRVFPNTKDKTGIGRVMMVIHQAVERRMSMKGQMNGAKCDMLECFISKNLTIDRAPSELLVVLTSGVVSTSFAAQCIIRCICLNPEVYRKLQAEVDATVAEQKYGSHECVENSIVSSLSYLQACKYEGLRLYPPVLQFREQEVPPQGYILHGYRLPPGTFVGLNSLATQRHSIYGECLDEFRPERWLDIDDVGQMKDMLRTLELVFGYGASRCLGINIAHMELNKIIFELFRKYDVSFVNAPSPKSMYGDFTAADFVIKLELRNL